MNYNKELSVYRWAAVAMVMLTLIILASGGLGVIWMRQQISQTATHNALLKTQIAELDRVNDRLHERIAKVHNPSYLMGGSKNGLRPTDERTQVVWMSSPSLLFPEQRDSEPSRDVDSPLTISFDLATLDPGRRTHSQ